MDRATDTEETTMEPDINNQDWLIEKSDPYAEAWGDEED